MTTTRPDDATCPGWSGIDIDNACSCGRYANSHPNTPTMYHGTSVPLAPGTMLLPGATVGRDNHPGIDPGHGDRVHATTDLAMAAVFAMAAASLDDRDFADAFVYEVRPCEWIARDPGGIADQDHIMPMARVVREVDPSELAAGAA